MLRVYGVSESGNCYKVKLLLAQLELPFEWVEVDMLGGETRTPAYLAKNPNGRVPLLQLEGNQYLPESNAILNYLADGTEFLPGARLERARVLQWMFFEQYSHEPYIATSRFIVHFLGQAEQQRAVLEEKRKPGYAALDIMETHLKERTFFVAERYSIADIGLYAYTHVADEGGFELGSYTAIGAWLDRVRAQPNHVAMR
jgi:glutathione S-transferase